MCSGTVQVLQDWSYAHLESLEATQARQQTLQTAAQLSSEQTRHIALAAQKTDERQAQALAEAPSPPHTPPPVRQRRKVPTSAPTSTTLPPTRQSWPTPRKVKLTDNTVQTVQQTKEPLKIPTDKPTKAPQVRHLSFAAAAASSTPKTQSVPSASPSRTKSAPSSLPPPSNSASTFRPSKVRLNVWREIPSSCRSHFLAVVVPMFESYAKHSAAGEFKKCAEILHIMLDLPGTGAHQGRPHTGAPALIGSSNGRMEVVQTITGLIDNPFPILSYRSRHSSNPHYTLSIPSPSLPLTSPSTPRPYGP